MKARIKLSDIHALAADYALELHAVGKVEGEYLVLPLVAAQAIKNRHRPQPKKLRGLGDLIHRIALPIAKALKLGCVDPATNQLRPESPCAKRREQLNKAVSFSK